MSKKSSLRLCALLRSETVITTTTVSLERLKLCKTFSLFGLTFKFSRCLMEMGEIILTAYFLLLSWTFPFQMYLRDVFEHFDLFFF